MELITKENLQTKIFTIRGVQVILDYHLAEFYNVETKRINEQVKRNEKRFPERFMFQLTNIEWVSIHSQLMNFENENNLWSQIATSKGEGWFNRRRLRGMKESWHKKVGAGQDRLQSTEYGARAEPARGRERQRGQTRSGCRTKSDPMAR